MSLSVFVFLRIIIRLCSDNTVKGENPTFFFQSEGAYFAHSTEFKEPAVFYPRLYAIMAYKHPLQVLSTGQGVPLFYYTPGSSFYHSLIFVQHDNTDKETNPGGQATGFNTLAALPMASATRRTYSQDSPISGPAKFPPSQIPGQGSSVNRSTFFCHFARDSTHCENFLLFTILKKFAMYYKLSNDQVNALLDKIDSILQTDDFEDIETKIDEVVFWTTTQSNDGTGYKIDEKVHLLFQLKGLLKLANKSGLGFQ